jgi:hypothetical protein
MVLFLSLFFCRRPILTPLPLEIGGLLIIVLGFIFRMFIAWGFELFRFDFALALNLYGYTLESLADSASDCIPAAFEVYP